MKKIEFGFSNDIKPSGSWEGIGIKPGLLLNDAEYFGAIGFDGNNYIVAKVISDEFNRYPELLNNFIVRDAIYDMYADGTGVLFLDQEQSLAATKIEQYINGIKDQINSQEDILKNCNGIGSASKSFKLLELEDDNVPIIATSINSEVFQLKNNAIKKCQSSISDMQIELSSSYTK